MEPVLLQNRAWASGQLGWTVRAFPFCTLSSNLLLSHSLRLNPSKNTMHFCTFSYVSSEQNRMHGPFYFVLWKDWVFALSEHHRSLWKNLLPQVIFLCPFFLVTQVQVFPSSLYILAVAPFAAPWESQITSVTTSGKSNVHLGSMEWWYTGAYTIYWWPSEMHSCAFSILTPRRSAKKARRCHTVSLLIEVLLYCVCTLKLNVCLPIT